MADALGDLGKPVQDRSLVLNHLCSLARSTLSLGCIANGMHCQRSRPFPTFLATWNDLLLKDLNIAKRSSTLSAFVATTGGPYQLLSSASGVQFQHQHQQPASGTRGAPPKNCGGRRNQRNQQQCSAGQKSQPQATTTTGAAYPSGTGTSGPPSRPSTGGWPSFHIPWTGAIQMCPGPRPPLAPLPPSRLSGQQPQQAFLGGAQQPRQPPQAFLGGSQGQWTPLTIFNPLTRLPSWDQQAVSANFNPMSLVPAQQGDWYFDTELLPI